MQHLKKIPRTSVIQIWPKIWNFVYQSFEKKSKFMIFASKFSEIFVELGPFSGQSFKICPKWLFCLGPNIILEKVRKFQNIWIIPWEMAANLPNSRCIIPPSHLLGFITPTRSVQQCGWKWKFEKFLKFHLSFFHFTPGLCIMRFSLLRFSLLRFFKTFQYDLVNAIFLY